jgi:regulator of sigma E protease
MDVLIQASQFFLSLSILIILHEFGHFSAAKAFGMRVERFYLFFNPYFSLFKKKIGDTVYGIGWLPLGGYVKISGMVDESMDKEQMAQPPQPWEFRSKPAWQRLIVMIGGVVVNVILGVVIYWGILFYYGESYLPNANVKYGIMADSLAMELGLRNGDRILYLDGREVDNFNQIPVDIVLNEVKVITVEREGEVVEVKVPDDIMPKLMKARSLISVRIPFHVDRFAPGSVAKEAGFEKGDVIVGLNGETIPFFDEFKNALQAFKGETVEVGIMRDGQPMQIEVEVPESGLLGVYPVGDLKEFFDVKEVKYGFFESFPKGMEKAYGTFSSYIQQMKLIFSPSAKGYESLGGFITIGSIFSTEWNWLQFWSITAFLSIVLAVMNILPIPALDGGHVVFLLYEMVTGKQLPDKVLEVAQYIGMILLFTLLIFANGNDIFKLFAK